jgi:hypothetical protein
MKLRCCLLGRYLSHSSWMLHCFDFSCVCVFAARISASHHYSFCRVMKLLKTWFCSWIQLSLVSVCTNCWIHINWMVWWCSMQISNKFGTRVIMPLVQNKGPSIIVGEFLYNLLELEELNAQSYCPLISLKMFTWWGSVQWLLYG